jgi:hypothetical protein
MSRRFKAKQWESTEYEEEAEEGEVKVEHFGSPTKCAFCDKPASRVTHCWSDPGHCSEIYVCELHFWNKVWRDFVNNMFWNFGYKRLEE